MSNIPADREIRFFKRDRVNFPWLSNFYRTSFILDGSSWATVEQYYQYSKFVVSDLDTARKILATDSPSEAKRLGRKGKLDVDWWRMNRDQTMMTALRAKFGQNKELYDKLLLTEDAVLIEDTPWDPYWGIGKGGGRNQLGKLLMQLRAEYRQVESNLQYINSDVTMSKLLRGPIDGATKKK